LRREWFGRECGSAMDHLGLPAIKMECNV